MVGAAATIERLMGDGARGDGDSEKDVRSGYFKIYALYGLAAVSPGRVPEAT